MIGFDFVRRLSDTSRRNKYIIISFDYFTEFLLAQVVPDSQGKSALSLLIWIVPQFMWPWVVYTDNCTYFVSGEFAILLTKLSIIYLSALKSHTQSVYLVERYLKLLVDSLMVTVIECKLQQWEWNLIVNSVVYTINTQVLRVNRFSPAKLLLGFNPNRTGWNVNHNTKFMVVVLSTLVASGADP